MYQEIVVQKFKEIYKKAPSFLIKAPGRINLIGEHTDYNNGFVLPAAIDKAIYFAVSPRTDNKINIFSVDLKDKISFSTNSLKKSKKSWANFLIGAIAETIKKCFVQNDDSTQILGFDIAFGGDIPLGAGLSSSAAVESGMVFIIKKLNGFSLSKLEMALIAQQAEHNFAGVKCGIMDMFASIHGKENSVIKLDCRDLTFEYFPFQSPDYQLILCNTGVKHNLGDSAYNKRREECESGVRIMQEAYPQIDSLRDATIMMLRSQADKLPEDVFRRCKYVIEEIERVNLACEALQNNEMPTFGKLMYQTHTGLQCEYEVSCDELDFLVERAKQFSDVLGARMMGGGFGGCTINLVKKSAVESFILAMTNEYKKIFKLDLETYIVNLTNGVEEILYF